MKNQEQLFERKLENFSIIFVMNKQNDSHSYRNWFTIQLFKLLASELSSLRIKSDS